MRRHAQRGASARRAERAPDVDEATPDQDEIAKLHLIGSGKDRRAFFPRIMTDEDPPLRLGFLDFLPSRTAQALADGWVMYASASLNTFASLASSRRDLLDGFVKFLLKKGLAPTIGQIDYDLLDAYRTWITDFLSKGYVRGRDKRVRFEAAIKGTLSALRDSPVWKDALSPALEFPSPEPRRGSGRQGGRTPPIKEATYDALWIKAGDACRDLIATYEDGLAELDRTDGRAFELAATVGSPVRLAAYVLAHHPDIPRWSDFRQREGTKKAGIDRAQFQAAHDLLLPPMATMIGPMLVIAMIFALNPSTLKRMRFKDDYRFEPIGGTERIRIFPEKPRSQDSRQRNSVAVTADFDNPGRVIRLVERMTERLRERANGTRKGALFLWLPPKVRSVQGFGTDDALFRKELAKFSDGLGEVMLKQIRTTTLDRVHRITGGDLLKMKAVANHRSVETTNTDYATEGAKRRDRGRHGNGLLQLERTVRSGGRIAVSNRTANVDHAAATPGYECIDPLTSPIVGEPDGNGLCGAYGRCPICPHAVVKHTPEAYRYLTALRERIDAARDIVDGPVWLARWAPVRRRLVIRHLRTFPPDVRKAAEDVVVPSLPNVE